MGGGLATEVRTPPLGALARDVAGVTSGRALSVVLKSKHATLEP
jgi:hypothetical protein